MPIMWKDVRVMIDPFGEPYITLLPKYSSLYMAEPHFDSRPCMCQGDGAHDGGDSEPECALES